MDHKEKHKRTNQDSKLIKRIYYLAVAILVSFWCVVAVVGIKLSSYTKTLEDSQVQLEKIEETVKEIDMDSLNDTINTINQAIKKIKPFLEE